MRRLMSEINMRGMNEKGVVIINWILGALILLIIAFGIYYLYLNIYLSQGLSNPSYELLF